MAERKKSELLEAIEDLLRSDETQVGLKEQVSQALLDFGTVGADDAPAQRRALIDILDAANTLMQAIVGARINGPFFRLISALSDANLGKPDPLLKPTPRNTDKDDRKIRGAPPSPSSKVARIATFIGYADAIAAELGDVAKSEAAIAALIEMDEKSFSEQRKHGADYQSASNKAIFEANRESGKMTIIEAANKRNWTCLETAERLIPKLFESGALARPRAKREKS